MSNRSCTALWLAQMTGAGSTYCESATLGQTVPSSSSRRSAIVVVWMDRWSWWRPCSRSRRSRTHERRAVPSLRPFVAPVPTMDRVDGPTTASSTPARVPPFCELSPSWNQRASTRCCSSSRTVSDATPDGQLRAVDRSKRRRATWTFLNGWRERHASTCDSGVLLRPRSPSPFDAGRLFTGWGAVLDVAL